MLEGYRKRHQALETASGGKAAMPAAEMHATELRYGGPPGWYELRVQYRSSCGSGTVSGWGLSARTNGRVRPLAGAPTRFLLLAPRHAGVALRPGDQIRIEGFRRPRNALDYLNCPNGSDRREAPIKRLRRSTQGRFPFPRLSIGGNTENRMQNTRRVAGDRSFQWIGEIFARRLARILTDPGGAAARTARTAGRELGGAVTLAADLTLESDLARSSRASRRPRNWNCWSTMRAAVPRALREATSGAGSYAPPASWLPCD